MTTDESAEALEPIVKSDRQISVLRVADELRISKITVHEIVSQRWGMSKVFTQWVMQRST